jgi:hypothetical protein
MVAALLWAQRPWRTPKAKDARPPLEGHLRRQRHRIHYGPGGGGRLVRDFPYELGLLVWTTQQSYIASRESPTHSANTADGENSGLWEFWTVDGHTEVMQLIVASNQATTLKSSVQQ